MSVWLLVTLLCLNPANPETCTNAPKHEPVVYAKREACTQAAMTAARQQADYKIAYTCSQAWRT